MSKKGTGLGKTIVFKAKIWLYQGQGAWHFITVPKNLSADIRKKHGAQARGWGSLPVTVTIGKTTWQTSIFPESKSATYLLPIKAHVRNAEGVQLDDVVQCMLRVR